MSLLETLNHLQNARKFVVDGQRDLASQRKLMQGTYVHHLNSLEHKLLEELRLNDAEDA
jgi:hypothetical protein